MNISATTYSAYPTGFNTVRTQDTDYALTPPGQTPETSQTAAQTDPPPAQTPTNPNSSSTGADTKPSESEQGSQADTQTVNGHELTLEEVRMVDQLKERDTEVRRHEMAHVAAGGRYITSGANFSYERGPNGVNYAVGGEVSIDTSPIPGDPQATIQKMKQVKNAALAPANPSAQDLKVASNATSAVAKALSELMISQAKALAEKNEEQAFGNPKDAADTYEQVNNLPDTDTSSFQIAV